MEDIRADLAAMPAPKRPGPRPGSRRAKRVNPATGRPVKERRHKRGPSAVVHDTRDNNADTCQSGSKPAKKHTRISEWERAKVVTLSLLGFSASEIADRLGCDSDTCRIIINEADRQSQKLGRSIILAHVADRFLGVLQNHKHTSTELYSQLVDLQAGQKALREQLRIAKVALEAGSEVAKGSYSELLKQLATIDGQAQGLARDITRNDKDFVDMITRMGVPQPPDSLEGGSHTPAAITMMQGIVSNQDPTAPILEIELKAALERQNKWLESRGVSRETVEVKEVVDGRDDAVRPVDPVP